MKIIYSISNRSAECITYDVIDQDNGFNLSISMKVSIIFKNFH